MDMRTTLRLVVPALIVLLSACATPAAKPAPNPAPKFAYSPLILISIDGFRADYLDRGLTPTLSALAQDGVHAQAMQSAFPTLTFPNHYSIVTGLYPDHHGIVNNRITDPLSGKRFVYNDKTTTTEAAWWGGTPIWVSAELQGKHAGTMFWPGSDVAIEGVRPSQWVGFDKTIPSDNRVDRVLGWFDLPADQRPLFLTLYFEAVDHAGHDFGPDAPQVTAALKEVDGAIARLIEGLKQRGIGDATNLVIVSDHGMTASGADKVVILDKILDMSHVDLIGAGVIAGLEAKPGFAAEVAKSLIGQHEHMRCWHKSELPARLHYGSNSRIPDLFCLADDGYTISTQEYLDNPKHHFSKGEHGYDNEDPNMRALFIAHGPAFKQGLTVAEFENVNVYPLLTHVLGIIPAPNDGDPKVTQGMLR
jgi:predicted AlkP superfamily pyrophosphatase or phosphodiesterase